MKNLFISIVVFLAMTVSVNATDLRWDESDGAKGYTVYGTSENSDNKIIYDAGLSLFVSDIDLTLGLSYGTTYIFEVRAYNDAGESDASNLLSYTTAPAYIPPENNIPIRVSSPVTITIIIE